MPNITNHALVFALPATSATGPHPFPSRTRSLSLSAPMVLPSRGGGRVGRRRRLTEARSNSSERASLLHFPKGQLRQRAGDRTLGANEILAQLAPRLHPGVHPARARPRGAAA